VAQREGRANGTMVDIRGEQITVKSRESVDVAGLNSKAEIIRLERDRGATLSVMRLDEGLLLFCLPHSRLYGESL
jgi:hypothetical protein